MLSSLRHFTHRNGFGKEVPVSFEVCRTIFDTIITDEEWLWQMLLNLLTNACKYTDRGSIHVKVSLTHEIKKDSEKTGLLEGTFSSIKNTNAVAAAEVVATTATTNYLLFEVADTGLCFIIV
jgi:signal transduction histidine kinase